MPELEPSRLGTKEHWDNVYEEELQNFEEIGEEGEIWFGVDAVDKMVKWTTEHVPVPSHPLTMEVGCGNGTLLLALLDAGYEGKNLYGVDYSAGAVALAEKVSRARGDSDITYTQLDFLSDDPPPRPKTLETSAATAVWDLILDKGTYDAIALGEKDSDGHSPAAKYPAAVSRLLKAGGYFLITSCNFTEEELKDSFQSEATKLHYHSRVQHPVFTFGGKSGSPCVTVAFRKS